MSATRTKVVFFSPHAGIWSHALPESYLAQCLDPADFTVSRIMCTGTFSDHCIVMEASRIGIDHSRRQKSRICRDCIANAGILRGAYRDRNCILSDYLGADEIAQADTVAGNLKITDDIRKVSFLGVDVGKIASYEVLIKFKKTSLSFTSEEFAYFRTYVRNSLLSLLAFRHLHEELRPDVLVAYSPQYAVNGVAARYCELKGTRVYFAEGSANFAERYRALRVWDWTRFGLTNPALQYWGRARDYRLTEEDIARVKKHTTLLVRAGSFSVYSEPASHRFDVREHFGVPAGARVVLAAMSSYDEVFSAYVIERFPSTKYLSRVFEDQLAWIRYTIDFFSAHTGLFLIIRIHPRTFPHDRNMVMAAEQAELVKILATLPPNVRANYPTDKISIYDVYPQIDALVTGWSATGVEAMTFGVPVVTYDRNLPSYPGEIHYTGESREEYCENLLAAAAAGRDGAVVEQAYRWLAFSMSLGVVRHPAPFRETAWIARNQLFMLALRVGMKFFPGLVKRLEAGRAMRSPDETRRFNALLGTGACSLYDIPPATLARVSE